MNRVIIAGSRTFTDYDRLAAFMDQWTLDNDMGPDNTEFISGEAVGADTLGKKWALSRGYKVLLYPADWNKYGNYAGYVRNREMADSATHLVAFWNGVSNGTTHMLTTARGRKLKVHEERY